MRIAVKMDVSVEGEDNVELFIYENHQKRRTLVCPWRNREEFIQVYNFLFAEDANKDTKLKAYKRMLVWKMRRLNFTPATVLGTLVILEVQLRDDPSITDKQTCSDLRILYSSAFTRFLNYMSSIMQTRNMKTMYETARELGIESFLVDLRHLCAHGQHMPSLDIFRRTSDYCIKWLKQFYWDHEKLEMRNADAKQIRQKDRTEFDEKVSELFVVYDAAFECLFKNAKQIHQAKKNLNTHSYGILKKYSNNKSEKRLDVLLEMSVKDLSALVRREPGLKDLRLIYNEALLKMNFFFESVSNHVRNDEDIANIIELNRALFRAIALFGFIEDLFHSFILICENKFEPVYRRKGASFWANQISVGFIAFKDFKKLYKVERENNPEINYDLSTINTHSIAKDVLKIYSQLNVDVKKILIFGDTFRRPWALTFPKSYIQDRFKYINEYTVDILKNCLNLVVPPLEDNECAALSKFIDIYFVNNQDDEEANGSVVKNAPIDSKIFTLKEDVLNSIENDIEMTDADLQGQKYGIWSTLSDGQDWHTCPLGRLLWE